MLSGAVWFCVVIVGLFVVRGLLATWLFLLVLPEGERCPVCDEPTLRMESHGINRMLPWFRPSWCYQCGWEGWLRNEPSATAERPAFVQSGRPG